MATPVLIDLSNYDTLLVRSTEDRSGTPDGNVYFDTATGEIQFLSATDVADVTYPTGHPGYTDGNPEANPLTQLLGLKFEAAYAFENMERAASYPADGSGPSEDLRSLDRWTKGTFKFGGSYNFIFGKGPIADEDRNILRGSGWNEMTGTTINRKYFGVKGLGAIVSTSIPYYQSTQYGTTTPFNKLGNIDEATQVFGDGANGAFDNTDTNTTNMYMSIRTYGKNYGRINAKVTLGISELGGYSTGAALNESDHLTTGAFALADVYGGAQQAPWTGMSLEKLAAAQHETGFSGGDTGDFIWVLNNDLGGTLNECVAYLDALAQEDDDVTIGESILNGKAYDVWYEYTATGKVRPLVGEGTSSEGLFIENLPAGDKTSVEFIDDADQTLEYPVFTPVSVDLGAGAIADSNAWFHTFEAAAYDSVGAVTYQDAVSADVKGIADVSDPFVTATSASFEHDFTSNGDQDVIFLCEGDGAVTQAKTAFTISSSAVSQACIPATETNV